jgi:membrane-associated phospholipid phosphatase
VFFLYIAVLSTWRSHGVSLPATAACVIPIGLVTVARADSRSTVSNWSIVRDWIPAVLLLVAYWSIDWVPAASPDRELERALVVWDRTLLSDWGARAATEQFGLLLPTVMELAYLALYAVLPLSIASFYLHHERERLDDFLFPFLVGTLTAYALLPHFPVEGPRFAFSGEDLPNVESVFRRMNLWILNHWDIRSSVFPSGHVAAAFSAAFAMRLAAPGRRALFGALLAIAVLVWMNTVYGRYHYAADGLASLAVSASAIGLLLVYDAFTERTQCPTVDRRP